MSRTFLPKAHYMPWRGLYRPMFRRFKESPWELVPKCAPCATAGQAIAAAEAYLEKTLNPPIRAEQAPAHDALNVAGWHEARAARQAEQQEAALGAVIVKGKAVIIERRKRA